MAKKTDSKTAAKPVQKKAVAKPAATSKPAAAAKQAVVQSVAAKSKPPAKAATKPAAKKTASPTTAVKKSAAKTKASASPVAAKSAGQFFYFLSETIDPQVTPARPSLGHLGGQVSEFAEFVDVRQHAIDYLVDLIDRCEVRLWQIKRADSLDVYQQLIREHDHPPLPAAGEEAPPAPS